MREWIAITDEIGPERVFHVEKRDLFSLPVDILIPGARPHVIDRNNSHRVQAKIISSIANIPIKSP